jgi:hypothetical protein
MPPLTARKNVLLGLIGLLVAGLLTAYLGDLSPSAGAASARIEVWHGQQQKVGHLGLAQPEFNLMGRIQDPEKLLSLQYALNDSTPVELNFRSYRRLARDGHFNADIPIASLRTDPIRSSSRGGSWTGWSGVRS